MHIVIVLLISWDFHLNRKIISITLGGSKSLTNRGKEFVLRESHWPDGFKIHSPRDMTLTWPWHHPWQPSTCTTMFYQYTRASNFETFSFHLCPMFWQETDLWIQKKHTPWCAAHPVNHDKNTSKYMSCDIVTSVTLSSFNDIFSISRQRTGLFPPCWGFPTRRRLNSCWAREAWAVGA